MNAQIIDFEQARQRIQARKEVKIEIPKSEYVYLRDVYEWVLLRSAQDRVKIAERPEEL